jgi:predicted DCC family thiol-disulfide oxidoreductase YuxK
MRIEELGRGVQQGSREVTLAVFTSPYPPPLRTVWRSLCEETVVMAATSSHSDLHTVPGMQVEHNRCSPTSVHVMTQQRRDGVLLYDGECGFCTRTVEVLARLSRSQHAVRPWQAEDVSRWGLTEAECAEAVQWAGNGRTASGPEAVREYLCGGPLVVRVLARVLINRLTLPLGWPLYRLIARNRHRLPPRSCAIPRG